jgi:hypothetical protein
LRWPIIRRREWRAQGWYKYPKKNQVITHFPKLFETFGN